METRKQCVPFVLLFICYVATNNIKVFSAVMKKPTMGCIRIVAHLQCSYQQCKSVQCCRERATMGSIRIVAIRNVTTNNVSVQCCRGRATMGYIRIVAICNVAINNVKVFSAAT
jgi:hypothetical protein